MTDITVTAKKGAIGPKESFCEADTKINDMVHDYTLEQEWVYAPMAKLLWEWFDIFNEEVFSELGGPLPRPSLRFEHLRSAYGTYTYNHSGSGLRFQIVMATNDLHGVVDVRRHLKTWLHEILHQHQELRGKPGKGNYHNKAFQSLSKKLGIPSDVRGWTIEIPEDGKFNQILKKYGIPSLVIKSETTRTVASTRMKKWECDCTIIRAAVAVEAKCLKCGQMFHRK